MNMNKKHIKRQINYFCLREKQEVLNLTNALFYSRLIVFWEHKLKNLNGGGIK